MAIPAKHRGGSVGKLAMTSLTSHASGCDRLYKFDQARIAPEHTNLSQLYNVNKNREDSQVGQKWYGSVPLTEGLRSSKPVHSET